MRQEVRQRALRVTDLLVHGLVEQGSGDVREWGGNAEV
jgi:hypothetical protein